MKNLDKVLMTQLKNMGCKFTFKRKKIAGGKIGNLFYIVFPYHYTHTDILNKVKEFYKKSVPHLMKEEDKIVIDVKS